MAQKSLNNSLQELHSSRQLVQLSDEVHDRLSTLRLIFDYIFTKYGNHEYRRDIIMDFKVSEIENMLDSLESFIGSYQKMIERFRNGAGEIPEQEQKKA
jgi:hypothetical protein